MATYGDFHGEALTRRYSLFGALTHRVSIKESLKRNIRNSGKSCLCSHCVEWGLVDIGVAYCLSPLYKTARVRRRSPSRWPYHGLSAGVLLLHGRCSGGRGAGRSGGGGRGAG